MFPCPNDEFRAISEEPAGDVWRRIGLRPRHYIQYSETKFL